MASEPQEIMGIEASAPVPTSTLIVAGAVLTDMEKASVDGELQAGETEKRDGGKAQVVEVEKKDGRRQMASRSEMWNHFEKVMMDGVLQKGKCNYCKSDISYRKA